MNVTVPARAPASPGAPRRPAAHRRLDIVAAPARGLAVHTPRGVRIDGAQVDDEAPTAPGREHPRARPASRPPPRPDRAAPGRPSRSARPARTKSPPPAPPATPPPRPCPDPGRAHIMSRLRRAGGRRSACRRCPDRRARRIEATEHLRHPGTARAAARSWRSALRSRQVFSRPALSRSRTVSVHFMEQRPTL